MGARPPLRQEPKPKRSIATTAATLLVVLLPLAIGTAPTVWLTRQDHRATIAAAAQRAKTNQDYAVQWAAYEVGAANSTPAQLEKARQERDAALGLDENAVNRKIAGWAGEVDTITGALALTNILALLILACQLINLQQDRRVGAQKTPDGQWRVTFSLTCAGLALLAAVQISQQYTEALRFTNIAAQTHTHEKALEAMGELIKEYPRARAEIGNETITAANQATVLRQVATKRQGAERKREAAKNSQLAAWLALAITLALMALSLNTKPHVKRQVGPANLRQARAAG